MATPPDSIPGFQLQRLLSRRGSQEVWAASSEGGVSDIPTHVLRLDRDPAAAEVGAELAVLFGVLDPSIAALEGHGPLPGGGYWLARPWVRGTTLDVWAKGRSPEEIGGVVAALAPALDAIHDAGFVHADIKASNVIVGEGDRPSLVDFALSHAARGQAAGGSYYTASPEVILGIGASQASDLFALGAMLHGLLVPSRRPAREFYADFPRSSFLDAAGTPPEALPEWSRDLVVSLTARDPARRPESAGAVGRSLAARLGLPYDGRPNAASLRLPAGLGRAAILQRSLGELGTTPLAWGVPSPDDGPGLFESTRVAAALAGIRVHAVTVAANSAFAADDLQRDAWACDIASAEADLILASVTDCPVHAGAVLTSLMGAVHGAELADGQQPKRLCAFVPARVTPPSGWRFQLLPPIAPASLLGFLTERVEATEPEVLERFAANVVEAAGGSAARIEALLRTAFERGAWIAGERGLVLNTNVELDARTWPGFAHEHDEGATDAERDVLGALAIRGGKITANTARTLLPNVDVEGTLRRLVEARRVRIEVGRITLAVPVLPRLSSLERTRGFHQRLASELEGAQARAHALVGEPQESSLARWNEAVNDLAERGQARVALELFEKAEAWKAAVGDELPSGWNEEKALLWSAVGQMDVAERTLADESEATDERASAVRALVRARVARHQGRTQEVRKLLESASKLDVRAAGELMVEELRELSGQARDNELVARVLGEEGRTSALQSVERGELRPRQAAFVRSLASLSLQRIGRGEEGRALAEELLRDAVAEGDEGREAALRVNLATIERRLGRPERAIEELDRAQDAYGRSGSASGLAQVKETLGGVLREGGELIRAEALTREALGLRERLGDSEGAARVRGLLGLILCERGHVRPAIAALEEGMLGMVGAQRKKHVPYLEARAREQRARLGLPPVQQHDSAPDPRVLMADARGRLFLGEDAEAALLAERSQGLAASLGLRGLEAEAKQLLTWIQGGPESSGPRTEAEREEQELYEAIALGSSAAADEAARENNLKELRVLAERMASRGRDDRAARAWRALSARLPNAEAADEARVQWEEALAFCTRGAAQAEAAHLERLLLARPDPCPADFAPRPSRPSDEGFEMEIVKLLEINHELLKEEDHERLLGLIVENAMRVTGAERGFLVLEEGGELRFDTARSSLRGPILEPELEVSASIVREALAEERALRVANASEDPELSSSASVVSLELRSVLCVPMSIDSDLRAALYLDHRLRTAAFDDRAERLAVLLGDQAALAIQKVRRLAEMRTLHAQVSRRYEAQRVDLEKARRALADEKPPGLDGLIGASPVMEEVRRLVKRFAGAPLPVLVTGSSGSGKEVVARALHRESPRSEGPFVSENCAAIPATLMESTLFGYERGAFTGADHSRAGLFEEAAEGTIFLDEIGELPLELQAKLLRVLETHRVRRIGSTGEKTIDFRLLAATNRDLHAEVEAGRFREDLFYRLDGLVLRLPDLSERVSDIPLLVQHFLDEESRRSGIARRIHPRVLAELSRRPWPGNVRELRNEIARLCVLEEGDLEDPTLLRKVERPRKSESDPDRILSLAELERQAILQALERTGGDKREAARQLGISRAKVYQRLKEWGASSS